MSHRLGVIGSTKAEMVRQLGAFVSNHHPAGVVQGGKGTEAGVVFVFGGQGPQWWGMGRGLFQQEEGFRGKIAECDEALAKLGAGSVMDQFAVTKEESRAGDMAMGQWMLFSLQVALAALWNSWGIEPAAVTGHSLGEVAAAHVAGVLTLDQAARVVFHRGRCTEMAAASAECSGRMLAAGLAVEEAEERMGDCSGVEIAAVNSPNSVTLTGDAEALKRIAAAIEKRGVFCRFLRIEFPFHSSRLDPWREELLGALSDLEPSAGKIRIVSTVTGFVEPGTAFDGQYWWRNARQPVLFANAINTLGGLGYDCFLEIGPHPVLTASIRESLASRAAGSRILFSLQREKPERITMLMAVGALHAAGKAVNWRRVLPVGRHVSLPSYPFRRGRHWNEAPEWRESRFHAACHPLLGRRLKSPHPSWEQKIHLKLLPYLNDHRARTQILFPGAGYAEMALAAVQELHGEGGVCWRRWSSRKRWLSLKRVYGRASNLRMSHNGNHLRFTHKGRMGIGCVTALGGCGCCSAKGDGWRSRISLRDWRRKSAGRIFTRRCGIMGWSLGRHFKDS